MSFGSTIGRNPEQTELRQCWRTEKHVFNALHAIYQFTVDACASPENALLERYWTKEKDCCLQSWKGERVFCNPPFSHTAKILAKVREADVAVFLLPLTALTTRYFAEFKPEYVIIPPTRMKFIPPPELKVRTVSPSLGTVILLYGATKDQAERTGTMGAIYGGMPV